MVSTILQQVAADQAVEEAELQRHVEQEKEREKELMKIHSKDKRGKKDAGRRSKTKSGTSPGKNVVPDTPTPGTSLSSLPCQVIHCIDGLVRFSILFNQ